MMFLLISHTNKKIKVLLILLMFFVKSLDFIVFANNAEFLFEEKQGIVIYVKLVLTDMTIIVSGLVNV